MKLRMLVCGLVLLLAGHSQVDKEKSLSVSLQEFNAQHVAMLKEMANMHAQIIELQKKLDENSRDRAIEDKVVVEKRWDSVQNLGRLVFLFLLLLIANEIFKLYRTKKLHASLVGLTDSANGEIEKLLAEAKKSSHAEGVIEGEGGRGRGYAPKD